jgi:hypothetical protein
MTQVDFFKVQVSYSGDFAEIEEQEWRSKARAKMDRGIDALDHTEFMDMATAKKRADELLISNIHPCNRIAEVSWAEIIEEV